MDCFRPITNHRPTWLPWLLLFLTTSWGGATLFAQIQRAPQGQLGANRENQSKQVRVLKELRPGLSEDRVRELLGRPNRLARQVLHLRYLEQWVYDSPVPLRIEIEHAHGQPPHVLTVQPLTSEKP
jgi:hypothetical protein